MGISALLVLDVLLASPEVVVAVPAPVHVQTQAAQITLLGQTSLQDAPVTLVTLGLLQL
jgi:hypothetical protein